MRIQHELKVVYGDTVAPELESQLERIVGSFRSRVPAAFRQWRGWSETQALLITYGDQVRAQDQPPLQALKRFLDRHAAGVLSGVHILPFYPYSSDDGFSVIDYLAIDPALGQWPDVSALGERFELMFDAVFNHISAKSPWFQHFLRNEPPERDYFIVVDGSPDLSQVVRPRTSPLLTENETAAGPKKVWTTFSADQVDLNLRNPEVLLRLIEALLLYVAHGARYIRLDAIAYLWKEFGTRCIHLPQTHALIRLMRAVLNEAAPDVRLVTETNVPHQENISYFGNGRDEAQMVYNFALPPLVLHTLATANATALSRWAETLSTPSRDTAFFNFLASHDGIGVNPARGILTQAEIDALVERVRLHGGFVSYKRNPDGSESPYELNINYFDALSNPYDRDDPVERQVDRFMAAQSIMLSLAGVPGIYFHSLFGSRNDRAAAEASGIPRRINRQKLSCETLETELADATSLRARVFGRYQGLLRARGHAAAFNPVAPQRVWHLDPRLFVVERMAEGGGSRVLCIHNVSPETVSVNLPQPLGSGALELINGRRLPDGERSLVLRAYEIAWVKSC